MRARGKYSDLFFNGEEKVPFPPIEQLTETLTAEAIRWIEEHAAEPFFLYLAHPMPHGPAAASERFCGQSEGGVYGDALETIVWSTGEILRTLERLKLARKTVVIYTSDNGADPTADWGVDADWFGSNAPLRGKKQQGWEGGVRVPCIAWGPGRVPSGEVCDELATVMDILPTFARLAGAAVPDDRVIDGHDIRPLLFGEPGASSPYDVFIYHVRFGKVAGIRMDDWKLLIDVDARTWRHRGTALYNLERDVAERHNVAAAHPEVVESLKAQLERFKRDLSEMSRPVGELP
jgi:arylsulfatase A-like enzyme